jgi:hypothetical protein
MIVFLLLIITDGVYVLYFSFCGFKLDECFNGIASSVFALFVIHRRFANSAYRIPARGVYVGGKQL